MKWTKNRPDEVGYFWYTVNEALIPQMVYVVHVVKDKYLSHDGTEQLIALIMGNTVPLSKLSGWWYGPFFPPEFPKDDWDF